MSKRKFLLILALMAVFAAVASCRRGDRYVYEKDKGIYSDYSYSSEAALEVEEPEVTPRFDDAMPDNIIYAQEPAYDPDAYYEVAYEQPYANHELIGEWAWDLDGSFVYNFYADGTGTRGFTGRAAPFAWETIGDHLIIRQPPMDESWTFTITSDVLTIDNRLVYGMKWSYVRQ